MFFEFLRDANPFLLVLFNGIFVVTLALIIHIYARKLVKGFITGDDTKIATMLFSVNASILSLLFSITLFQVRSEFNHITNSLGEEISQIDQFRRSVGDLSPSNQKEIIKKFHHYLIWVEAEEFESSITQSVIDESHLRFDDLRNTVLKMPPATFVEKQFRNQMLKVLEEMDHNRGVRLYRRNAQISPVFYLLLAIFLTSLIFLTTFERTKLSVIFVSAYALLGTVLLTFILLTSSYFAGEHTTNHKFYRKSIFKVEEKMLEIDALDVEDAKLAPILDVVEKADSLKEVVEEEAGE